MKYDCLDNKLEGKCKLCGSEENLVKHHISYLRGLTILLCNKCHFTLHLLWNKDRKTYRKLRTQWLKERGFEYG